MSPCFLPSFRSLFAVGLLGLVWWQGIVTIQVHVPVTLDANLLDVPEMYLPLLVGQKASWRLQLEAIWQGSPSLDASGRPSLCTEEMKLIIQSQLPPDKCQRNQKWPWTNRCSFTYATRCPDASWLDRHYTLGLSTATTPTAVYLGCNKGMDAVETLRMMSNNATFSKQVWKKTFLQGHESNYQPGHCQQELTEEWALSNQRSPQSAKVLCVEAMPITYKRLQQSAQDLQWNNAFHVINAAIGGKNGMIRFPSFHNQVGVEQHGIEMCRAGQKGGDGFTCENVRMLTLDTLSKEHLSHNETIDFLSIDIEGYDWLAMSGGAETLKRVKYLEFEYNWRGAWRNTPLSEAMTTLEGEGFVCYWIGNQDRVWRISGCFQDYYNLHFWSNIGCVNSHFPDAALLVQRLENLFFQTLAQKGSIHYDTDPLSK